MNKKGFTLVELLGVIVILGIIMLIAIPNIASLTQKNKKNTYIVDSKKMVSLAQRALKKGERDKPASGSVEVITLNDLSTSDVEKNADGIEYDINASYVAVGRDSDDYLVYGVQLVTKNGDNTTYDGIVFTRVENLDSKNKYNYYNENQSIVAATNVASIKTKLAQEIETDN